MMPPRTSPPAPNRDFADRASGISLPPAVAYGVNPAAQASDPVQDTEGEFAFSSFVFEEKGINLNKLNKNEDTQIVTYNSAAAGEIETARPTIPFVRTVPDPSREESVQAGRTSGKFDGRKESKNVRAFARSDVCPPSHKGFRCC